MQLTTKSKYKYLEGRPSKETFSAISVPTTGIESDGLACSGPWLAFPWKVGGGGKIVVKRGDQFGKCNNVDFGLTGHEGDIMDLQFNPFNDFLLASSSLDSTVKLWSLPVEGVLEAEMASPLTTLAGHSNKVQLIKWNPLAENILASGSARGETLIWDVTKEDPLFQLPVLDQNITALDWDPTGSTAIVAHRDKKFRIVDPRSTQFTAEWPSHQSSQPSKIIWTSKTELFSMGNSKMNESEVCGWDSRNTSEPVFKKVLGQGKRFTSLYFIKDNNILLTVSRGESTIQFYELVSEAPYLEKLMGWGSSNPQIGFTMLPRRVVDEKQCVIGKGARLQASSIEYVSFLVPRKSTTLQKDLFPPCVSSTATYSAGQWASGAEKEPLLMNWQKEDFKRFAFPSDAVIPSSSSAAGMTEESKSALADMQAELNQKDKEIHELRAEIGSDKAEMEELRAAVAMLTQQVESLTIENNQLKAAGQMVNQEAAEPGAYEQEAAPAPAYDEAPPPPEAEAPYEGEPPAYGAGEAPAYGGQDYGAPQDSY